MVTLAGGAGSRWSQGAGVVKALNPFARLGGSHRSFIEIHLAKSRRSGRLCGMPLPHIVTTSYLTHGAMSEALGDGDDCGHGGPLLLSPGAEHWFAHGADGTGSAFRLGGDAEAGA